MKYPWYVQPPKRDDIKQGEFLFDFPVVEPNYRIPKKLEGGKSVAIKGEINVSNYIIISHSCDIKDKTLDAIGVVQLCPIFIYEEYFTGHTENQIQSKMDSLRKDKTTQFHLLEKCEIAGFPNDLLIVDLIDIRLADIKQVRAFVRKRETPRLKLSHPYCEKLSARFANNYSRVGLPEDIK